jgi:hypothetical protein
MTTLIIFTVFLRRAEFLLNISLLQATPEEIPVNTKRVTAGRHKIRKRTLTKFAAAAVW